MRRYPAAFLFVLFGLYLAHSPSVLSLPLRPYQAQEEPKVAGTEVSAPKRTKTVQPEYPSEAAARGLRGIVILELIIDTDGRVASAEVIRSVPPFDEAALAAVRKWEYEPTKVDGKPVRVRLTVPITFAMKLPELERQGGIPELRQGAIPSFPPGAPVDQSATVIAEVTLDAQGQVAQAEIKTGDSPWSEALLQALRTWRFAAEEGRAILSFQVQAEFVGANRKGGPRVSLLASGLRRSESVTASEEPELEAQPSGARSPTPEASPSAAPAAPPRSAPAPSPSPAPSASPPPPPPSAPPVEVIRSGSPPAQAGEPSPPVPSAPGISAIRDVTLGEGVPDLMKGRRPVAPPLARMAGTTGSVEVHFAIDAAGAASVRSASGPEVLKTAAEQAVGSWVFRRTSPERLLLVARFNYEGDTARAEVAIEPET